MDRIEARLAVENMVSENEAARILNIKPVTLKTKVSKGDVGTDFFTVSPINGERFYFRDKILGLK